MELHGNALGCPFQRQLMCTRDCAEAAAIEKPAEFHLVDTCLDDDLTSELP